VVTVFLRRIPVPEDGRMGILMPPAGLAKRPAGEGADAVYSAPDEGWRTVRRWLAGPWGIRVVCGVLLAEVAVLVWFAFSFQAVDFAVYRWGGYEVAHGTQLYLRSAGPDYFTYPPLAAALFAPLTLVPAAWGQLLWELASVAALTAALGAVLKLAGARLTRTEIAAATAVSLLAEPVYHTLFNGQVNLFLLAVVAVDVWRVSRGRRGGGLGVGLAAALKLTPGIFIVLFLLARRTRAAMTAAVTFGACGLIGFLAAPSASRLYWTRCFYDTARVYPAYIANQSLYGAAIRIFGGPGHVGLWYLPLTIVVAVAGLGAAAVFARRGDWLRAMAVTGVTGLLVSPVSWTHHWVDAIPALVVLACGGKPARTAGACAFALFGLAPLWWTPHSLPHPAYGFHGVVTLVANCYLIAGLAFLGYAGRVASGLVIPRRPHHADQGEGGVFPTARRRREVAQ
jgi:alpha-1,2-mannosyltransferase